MNRININRQWDFILNEAKSLNLPLNNKRSLIREYLQTKILYYLYMNKNASNLSFMGGTCLHIVYGLNRFSEDLDFDNFGLTDSEIKSIIEKVSNKLIKEGFFLTLRVSELQKEISLYFPELLQDLHISGHKEEKLRINIDYDNKERIVQPETFLLSRFGIIQRIMVNKLSVIFAQKILAVAFRKRPIPRDFYDIIWLVSRSVLPDYTYLEKNGIKSNEVKGILLEKYDKLNKKQMVNELAPFLFDKDDIKKLDFLREIVKKI